MCFSANASFGVSAVLLIGGAISISKSRSWSQIPFASIPLLFAFQQFVEGFVWLSLTDPNYYNLNQNTTMVFLIFAQVVWPFWVPMSIMVLEQKKQQKKILSLFAIFGLMVSFYLGYCLYEFPVKSLISNHHIRYELNFQFNLIQYSGIFYFLPTVVPPFLSSVKGMLMFGLVIAISYLFTKIFYGEYVISVWCFFAAAMSIIITYIIYRLNPKRIKT